MMTMEPKRCKKCGSTSFEAKHVGPHIGWYCTKCGAWLQWISQHRKKKREPQEPHQISIDEWMQQNAPEQASMKDEVQSLYDDDDLPWE